MTKQEMMLLLKTSWNFISAILTMLLFAFGAWHGIVDENYTKACFELLLAYGCRQE